ncbi:MAG: FAD-binding protein [Candidatus Eisenbacteria bacterium]|nr:FAD-binding protein [Candidatus Eisenbacteria bacterium]
MEERVTNRLREIVGPECVLTSAEELRCHSCDATGKSALPEVVVRPERVEQVSAIARFCTEEGIPLTPRGAGTGLSGGAVPAGGGVSLSLTRMNKIREIVPEDLYVVVEAGAVTEELQRAVEAASLFYPPDPASRRSSTIGGNIGTAARGLRCLKYGVTKNYLMGLEIVLPTGDVMKTGARTFKSVAGYDLTRLMCGSGGTLAIVTSATLKLIPLPEHRVTVLAAFATLEKAAEASRNVISCGLTPSVLEIMDSLAVEAMSRDTALSRGARGCSLILAETDGFREAAETEADRVAKACADSGATFVEKSAEQWEREGLWEARRSVLTALAKLNPVTILENVTVPRTLIVEMIRSIAEISRKHELVIATFGHAGDGNLHPTILVDAPISEMASKIERAVVEISEKALSLGGGLSSEHVIGIEEGRCFGCEIEAPASEIVKRLKDAFDPRGILNPGKLLCVGR